MKKIAKINSAKSFQDIESAKINSALINSLKVSLILFNYIVKFTHFY